MRLHFIRVLFLGLVFLVLGAGVEAVEYDLEVPRVILTDTPFEAEIVYGETREPGPGRDTRVVAGDVAIAELTWTGDETILRDLRLKRSGRTELTLVVDGVPRTTTTVHVIPAWLSVLPPLLAIFAALLFRSVIPSLFAGVWLGTVIAGGFAPQAVLIGLLDSVQVHALNAIANYDHASILLFTCMIGGTVGVISRNGGMQGVVNLIVPWASTPRRGQLSVSFMGLCIFFDDYTNTLVIGNTVRPITDRLHISREKLAYLVDSTAAPIACIAVITTWVGYEVGLIATSIENSVAISESAYSIFLHSIAFNFYPILAIFFVLLVAYTGFDFGPMYTAEQRQRERGADYAAAAEATTATAATAPETGEFPIRAINAILPIATLIGAVLAGLYITGEGENLQQIVGSADAYKALLWASLIASLTAILMTIAQRIMNLEQTVEAWTHGVGMMIPPLMILVLAWSLADVTEVLHTADYLVAILGDGLPPALLPGATFVLAAACAFATGTSWGSMGILMPLVVPLALAILTRDGTVPSGEMHILYSSVACVLAGSVWGDHCSPISDTTVLSSVASGCDHIEHVRTQLPYALLVGAVALLFGTLPAGFGVPWWVGMLVGTVTLVILLHRLGRRITDPS